MLTAKEIAERFAGQTVQCKITKSMPAAGSFQFDAKVLGWSFDKITKASYVCVEVLPPAQSALTLKHYIGGYTWTVPFASIDLKAYGKRLYPEEIIIPVVADAGVMKAPPTKKDIPEWPDKCRDCGSPAFILSTRIDCSNAACKHKFKTHSAADLFLPKEMRPPAWEKDPNRKRRAGVDKEDFVVCPICNQRANSGTFTKDKLGQLKAACPSDHKWESDLHIGDKILGKDRVLIYKGKNIFITYKV